MQGLQNNTYLIVEGQDYSEGGTSSEEKLITDWRSWRKAHGKGETHELNIEGQRRRRWAERLITNKLRGDCTFTLCQHYSRIKVM